MPRKIIQIAVACPGGGSSDRLYAVCNDGSLFVGQERSTSAGQYKLRWFEMAPVPQPKSNKKQKE